MKIIRIKKTTIISCCALLLASCAAHFNEDKIDSNKQSYLQISAVGEIHFPVSCSAATQAGMEQGLALLHHMMYVEAEKQFLALAQDEPECAMTHWGIAMTLFHPLWPGQTRDAALQKGWAAVQKAKLLNPATQREWDYIRAAEALYRNWQSDNQAVRITSWAAAQEKLYRQYPNDTEAAVIYALSHLATAPKGDRTFTHQRQAGLLLEQLYVQYPKHPGILHYTIHAYDNPLLAGRAVTAANAYDKIAPEVPHALHMPTHIFVRLGLWDKVIDLNARSAQAALNYPVDGAISHHNPHALDYQMYAHLQKAEDGKAKTVLDKFLATDNYQKSFVSGYALAAMPARYYLERRQWKKAAQLDAGMPATFPWEKYPEVEAITYFARGLGAARSGDTATADKAISKLNALHEQTTKVGQQYWAVLIDAQRKTIIAWSAQKQGNPGQAMRLMRQAADLEDSVNKHPVTPGVVLPARELLGDMLMEAGLYSQALESYKASLKLSPNRFNSLYGAGLASEKLDDNGQAKLYYSKVIQLANPMQSNRPEINQAKNYLSGHQ